MIPPQKRDFRSARRAVFFGAFILHDRRDSAIKNLIQKALEIRSIQVLDQFSTDAHLFRDHYELNSTQAERKILSRRLYIENGEYADGRTKKGGEHDWR